jgi:hypothetical protein
MNPIVCNAAAVAVVLLYGVYRTHLRIAGRKQQVLRQRVAGLLWVMAERLDGDALAPSY